MGEPTPKQVAFLTKNNRPVPATAKEASDIIGQIYKEKGIPQRERPQQGYGRSYGNTNYRKNDYSDSPPTERMIAALKKHDWYTQGMTGADARTRLDILAKNNWRKPENVAAPETIADDLVY